MFLVVGTTPVRRLVRLDRAQPAARALLILHAALLPALLVFALSSHVGLAFAAWVTVNGLLDLCGPISMAWLNQNIPSNVRATVLSMSSQAGSFVTMCASGGLGAVADAFGVRAGLLLSSTLLLLPLAIFRRQAGQGTQPYPVPAIDVELP